MISEERDDQGPLVRIDATLDLMAAEEARSRLMETIERAGAAIRLDLTDGAPTVPALQLVLSARRQLRAAGAFAGWGPNAAILLGAAGDGSTASFTSVRSAA